MNEYYIIQTIKYNNENNRIKKINYYVSVINDNNNNSIKTNVIL